MLRRSVLLFALFAMPYAVFPQTYGSGVDPYFGNWHTAPVHTVYGALREQDVLTPGNPLHPSTKGAVLRSVKSFRHATLAAHATTTSIHLTGTQQVYYIESGSGEATPKGASPVSFSRGFALLIPDGLSMTLRNTGSQPLSFYIIEEPVPAGFHANRSILVRDANQLPFTTAHEQWSYIVKPIFTAADGLATLTHVSIVEMSALTIGRPKVTDSTDAEIVWTTLRGSPLAFVANELRHQPPGTAFLEVPDNKTPHSSIDPNPNDPVDFLVFAHDPSDSH